jgi:superfamily I DNA/RNA helicase
MSKEPTEEQKAIIESEHKYIHVEAGPGTGKTFTLLHRIKWLVDNNKLDSTQKILFVTFTNALTNANRRDLLKLGEEYQQFVSISTIDTFLYKMTCDLGTLEQVEKAQNFDTQYPEDIFNDILNNMPETYLKLIAKRYPYILIDEIQDVFQDTAKGNFVNKLSETSCHINLVGNSSQKVMNFSQNNKPLLFSQATPMKLSVSFRHEIKVMNNYAQYTPNDIDQHIQTEESFNSKEAMVKKFDDVKFLFNSVFIIHNTNPQNPFRNRNKEIEETLNKQELPYVILQTAFRGQLSLPQAVIESLYFKQNDELEKLPSLLHTFRKELKTDVSFTLFCSRYFASLLKARTFKDFKEAGWMSYLKEDSTQVGYLKSFFDAHKDLNKIPMSNFQKKIIVSTIHSVKGLEADVVFLLGKPTGELNYVAKTRHKKHFYQYP